MKNFNKKQILYVLENGSRVVYTHFVFTLEDNEEHILKKIKYKGCPSMKKICSRIELLNRLLRLSPRSIEKLDNNRFVICFLHKMFLLDFNTESFSKLQDNRIGFSDPLNICCDGENLYWGEYGNNAQRDVVHIYKMSKALEISIAYSFPANTIRHIHNIIFDSTNNCFWIFTGDNERLSGIYKSDLNWTKVTPIKIGLQKYRAVIGFPYKDGIVYATDSVDKDNYIYYLSYSNQYEPIRLTPINGSCIHGTEIKDYYVFSTTVEPAEGRGFLDFFSYKLGNGIKSRFVYVVALSKNTLKPQIVIKLKKDIYPMKLFQYGMVYFPKGQQNSNTLLLHPIACKKSDGKELKFKL